MPRRQVLVHRADHVLVGVRTGDLQYARMALEDALGSCAEAAGDDHAAVVLQRLADGIEGLIDRRIDEAAGVDHHHVRGLVARGDLVAFRAQLREDALGINQRLGAAEADEADLGHAAAARAGFGTWAWREVRGGHGPAGVKKGGHPSRAGLPAPARPACGFPAPAGAAEPGCAGVVRQAGRAFAHALERVEGHQHHQRHDQPRPDGRAPVARAASGHTAPVSSAEPKDWARTLKPMKAAVASLGRSSLGTFRAYSRK